MPVMPISKYISLTGFCDNDGITLKSEIQITEISAILAEVFNHCKVLCLYSTLPANTETNQSHNFHLIKPGLESKVQSSLDNASP
jgi:hypothetical protein